MKKIALSLSMVCCILSAEGLDSKSRVFVETGITNESLKWNFAANGIDVLSELSFEDSRFAYTKIGIERDVFTKYLLGVYASYGMALDGTVQDSDYGGSGRTKEYSRSISSTDDSSFMELGGYLGRDYKVSEKTVATPKIEYSLLYQKYTIKDTQQTLSVNANVPAGQSNPPAVGPIAGVDSSYISYWNTGFFGSNIAYQLNNKTSLELGGYGGFGYYYSEGHWNLRADLEDKSFEHTGFHWATKGSVGLKHQLKQNCEIYGGYRYSYYYLKNGDNVQFLTNGGRPLSNLNEVERIENRFNIGLNYKF